MWFIILRNVTDSLSVFFTITCLSRFVFLPAVSLTLRGYYYHYGAATRTGVVVVLLASLLLLVPSRGVGVTLLPRSPLPLTPSYRVPAIKNDTIRAMLQSCISVVLCIAIVIVTTQVRHTTSSTRPLRYHSLTRPRLTMTVIYFHIKILSAKAYYVHHARSRGKKYHNDAKLRDKKLQLAALPPCSEPLGSAGGLAGAGVLRGR